MSPEKERELIEQCAKRGWEASRAIVKLSEALAALQERMKPLKVAACPLAEAREICERSRLEIMEARQKISAANERWIGYQSSIGSSTGDSIP
jgi:hypothetical protein